MNGLWAGKGADTYFHLPKETPEIVTLVNVEEWSILEGVHVSGLKPVCMKVRLLSGVRPTSGMYFVPRIAGRMWNGTFMAEKVRFIRLGSYELTGWYTSTVEVQP